MIKRALRYPVDEFLKTMERKRLIRNLRTDRLVDCDVVFEMDDNSYRVLISNYMYDAFLTDGELIYTEEDPILLPNFGSISSIESRAREYNRRLFLADEQFGYINSVYFLNEMEDLDDAFIEETHERVLEEFDKAEHELSTLEMYERLMDSYDRVSNTFLDIHR